MNRFNVVRIQLIVFATFTLLFSAVQSAAASNAQATPGACSDGGQSSYPKAVISNGSVDAVLYLPDAKTGYYRGQRFDWSGVVGCLSYKGHTYFGVWFPHYDPLLHDAISGPVEEFRSGDGETALKFDQAKPGDLFVKIGVGVLRRPDSSPYSFREPYPIIDSGKWTVHISKSSAIYQQDLKSPIGIAYIYKKTLSLDKHNPVLILHHELKNTGTETIDTQVYNHDFYVIDNTPTGPDMVARFPFDVKAEKDLGSGARIDGKQIVYSHELQTGETAMSFLTGYSGDASSYDITVENQKTGVGVEQTGDQPISRINFWSIRTTLCPEAYVHIKVAPGETASWTIRYRFYAR